MNPHEKVYAHHIWAKSWIPTTFRWKMQSIINFPIFRVNKCISRPFFTLAWFWKYQKNSHEKVSAHCIWAKSWIPTTFQWKMPSNKKNAILGGQQVHISAIFNPSMILKVSEESSWKSVWTLYLSKMLNSYNF